MDEPAMALMLPLPMTTWVIVEGFDGLVHTHYLKYTRFIDSHELELTNTSRIFNNRWR